MTDNINTEKIEELIQDYVRCRSPKRRRKIETELLEVTLWKALDNREELAFAEYSEEELKIISKAVEKGDPEVGRLLRRPFVDKL